MFGYDITLYQNQSGLSTELSLVVGQQDGQGEEARGLVPPHECRYSSTTATCHVLESSECASAAKSLGILAVLATLPS